MITEEEDEMLENEVTSTLQWPLQGDDMAVTSMTQLDVTIITVSPPPCLKAEVHFKMEDAGVYVHIKTGSVQSPSLNEFHAISCCARMLFEFIFTN